MAASQTGRIFISYRRTDSAGYAGRIYDRLAAHFGNSSVFMDVDTIEAGMDFVDVLENAVQSCDVLIALIGRQWLSIKDEMGKRRLDNPRDFVRIEIAAALKRGIRVIPVLVDGITIPDSDQLPSNLKPLIRRNAVLINHHSFHTDANRLIKQLELVLEAAEESKILKAKDLQEKEDQKKRHMEVEKFLSQTDIALDLQDWELAKEKLKAVLILEPEHVQAQVKLEVVERKLRKNKEPNLAEKKAKQEAAKTLMKGKESIQNKDWLQAIQCFQQILELLPEHEEAQILLKDAEKGKKVEDLFDIAQKHFLAEQWSTAIAKFQKVLNIDPFHVDAKEQLVNAKIKLADETQMDNPISGLNNPISPPKEIKITKPTSLPEVIKSHRKPRDLPK